MDTIDTKGYIFINLLPYRARIKKEQIKQFSLLMVFFAIITGLVVFILYSIFSLALENQNSRNKFISQENTRLDANIKEIAGLREEIKDTLEKRKVVENLQINRSDTVSILNVLSKQLPEGMTLKVINEVENKITITGNTTSNNKVSNYMTNLAASNIFVNPELVEVKALTIPAKKVNAKVRDDQNISEFTINVYLKPKPEMSEESVKK